MATFGKTVKGTAGSHSEADYIWGGLFTCPETGTADSITVWLYNNSGGVSNTKTALYKDSDKSFVDETEEIAIPDAYDDWKTFNFSAPKPSVENIDYWIVVWHDAATRIYYDENGFVDELGYDSETYNSFPATYAPSYLSRELSIYCTYTPSGGGLSIPVAMRTYRNFRTAFTDLNPVKPRFVRI